MTQALNLALQNKNSAEAFYQQGRFFHDRDELKEAVRCYEQALSLDPSLAGAYQDMGTIYQERGQGQKAVYWYRKALDIDPSLAEAWYNLGTLSKENKKWEETLLYNRKALAIEPDLAEAHNNLGVAYYHTEKTDKAIDCWKKAVHLKPEYVSAYVNLGTAYFVAKRLEEAIQTFKIALALDPGQVIAWVNLGNTYKEKKEVEEAINCYRKALTLDPSLTEVYMNLGTLAMSQHHIDGAILCYQKAIELNPDSAETCYNLGNVYTYKKETDTAIGYFKKAIRLNPDYYEAYNNLGLILFGQGRFEESKKLFQKALELNPDLPEVLNNLGNIYKSQGRLIEAQEQYRRSIALKPEYPEGHWNLALTLLMNGSLEEGWPEYEWRWKLKGLVLREDMHKPLWNGEDIKGKRLLLHAEQGFGDTIQFIRYLPLVAVRGGRIVVECQPELASLLGGIEGIEEISKYGEPLPDHDVQCPLMSLPLVFQTGLSTIPVSIPYIFSDQRLINKWRDRLAGDGAVKKIGLVWAGKPFHTNDGNRSLSFEALTPLLKISEIRFYSLQKGEAAAQMENTPEGETLVDLSKELTDFSETAALIENLDLIISVDTAVAHLAGALGKPVWTLLPHSPDWRWLLNREDSPWYPTMRLFRQPAFMDWDGVIEVVATRLKNEL